MDTYYYSLNSAYISFVFLIKLEKKLPICIDRILYMILYFVLLLFVLYWPSLV